MHILFLFYIADCVAAVNRHTKAFNRCKLFANCAGLSTDSNSSLLKMFAKQGMDCSDLSRKCITYKMVENVLVNQRFQNLTTVVTKSLKAFKTVVPVSYCQVDAVLKAVRHKMQVSHVSNIESVKMSFESNEELGFGKWLTLNVMQQSTWSQIKHDADSKQTLKQSDRSADINNKQDANSNVLAYVTEEIYCKIAAVVDEFTEDKFNGKVLANITSKFLSDIMIAELILMLMYRQARTQQQTHHCQRLRRVIAQSNAVLLRLSDRRADQVERADVVL